MFKKIKKWFDLKLGWFFINGGKQNKWIEVLKDTYPDDNKSQEM